MCARALVLQVCERQQGRYSSDLAASPSGLEEHSAGHADQITRVCVSALLSRPGLPISAFALGINLVSWDHPGGDDVSLHFQIINHLH